MNTRNPPRLHPPHPSERRQTTSPLGAGGDAEVFIPGSAISNPVGQRFVELKNRKSTKISFLMDHVYRLELSAGDMSPIAVEPDFTRKYLSLRITKRSSGRFRKPSIAWLGKKISCFVKVGSCRRWGGVRSVQRSVRKSCRRKVNPLSRRAASESQSTR